MKLMLFHRIVQLLFVQNVSEILRHILQKYLEIFVMLAFSTTQNHLALEKFNSSHTIQSRLLRIHKMLKISKSKAIANLLPKSFYT